MIIIYVTIFKSVMPNNNIKKYISKLYIIFYITLLYSSPSTAHVKLSEIATSESRCIKFVEGKIKYNQDNFAEAINCLKKAVEFNSNNDDAYYQLSVVYLEQGDLTNALINIKQAIRINPVKWFDVLSESQRSYSYFLEGKKFYWQGLNTYKYKNLEEGIKILENAKKKFEKSGRVSRNQNSRNQNLSRECYENVKKVIESLRTKTGNQGNQSAVPISECQQPDSPKQKKFSTLREVMP